MGVSYKLNPDIINRVIERKRKNPGLSCRNLAISFKKESNLRLSKSAINSILKEAGLSLPVGRRSEKIQVKAKPVAMQMLPQKIAPKEIEKKAPPLEIKAPEVKVEIPVRVIGELQEAGTILLQAADYLLAGGELKDVRCIKMLLSDGKILYLDALFLTVWSTPYIAYDFASPLGEVKRALDKYFRQGLGLALFMSAESHSKDGFFSLLSSCQAQEKKIEKIVLCANTLEEIETVSPAQNQPFTVVFGLWPWQLKECRRIKSIGEFKRFNFEPLGSDYYLAEAEVELAHPETKQLLSCRGFALKKTTEGKTQILILSNLPKEKITPESVATAYLNRWPNLENTFRDFERKLELYTFTAHSRKFLNLAELKPDETGQDAFLRWHIFPSEYQDKELTTTQERFYSLPVSLTRESSYIRVKFSPPQGYAYLDDLGYACQRLNEREIHSEDGKKLWFSLDSPLSTPGV